MLYIKCMAKTTAKDFKLFKQECQKWIDYLGLKDWYIVYEQAGEDIEAKADITYNTTDGVARIRLAKEWDDTDHNDQSIRRTAFHEICELLISKMYTYGKDRFCSDLELKTASHEIIRTLENTLFKDVRP